MENKESNWQHPVVAEVHFVVSLKELFQSLHLREFLENHWISQRRYSLAVFSTKLKSCELNWNQWCRVVNKEQFSSSLISLLLKSYATCCFVTFSLCVFIHSVITISSSISHFIQLLFQWNNCLTLQTAQIISLHTIFSSHILINYTLNAHFSSFVVSLTWKPRLATSTSNKKVNDSWFFNGTLVNSQIYILF